MQTDLDAIRATGLELVAISSDDPAKLAQVAKTLGIGYPLLGDPTGEATIAFGVDAPRGRSDEPVIAQPMTFVIDASGIIRAKLFEPGFMGRHSTQSLIDAARPLAKPPVSPSP